MALATGGLVQHAGSRAMRAVSGGWHSLTLQPIKERKRQ